jgi:hypothetical protein
MHPNKALIFFQLEFWVYQYTVIYICCGERGSFKRWDGPVAMHMHVAYGPPGPGFYVPPWNCYGWPRVGAAPPTEHGHGGKLCCWSPAFSHPVYAAAEDPDERRLSIFPSPPLLSSPVREKLLIKLSAYSRPIGARPTQTCVRKGNQLLGCSASAWARARGRRAHASMATYPLLPSRGGQTKQQAIHTLAHMGQHTLSQANRNRGPFAAICIVG